MSTAASTRPREPVELSAAIGEVFGERADVARTYAGLLAGDGITRGVLGPREADRIWPRHIFNSAALAELIRPGARVVDLGSGAGLPGIPLAIARPDLSMVLLEPLQRRVAFLSDCVAVLGLERIQIVLGRAEAGIDPRADYVVARAIAPLERLVPLADRLLVDGGALLALKGSSAATEIEKVRRSAGIRAELLTVPTPEGSATVVRVVRRARARRGVG